MQKIDYPYMDQVKMALHLMFVSLTELRILNRSRASPDELKLLSSRPFKLYATSMQYMFTMELCKLLEPMGKKEGENVASLTKLNEFILSKVGQDFQGSYEKNRQILNALRKSEIHRLIRDNRNGKFAHSDGIQVEPYRITPLSDDDLNKAMCAVEEIKKIVDNCTLVNGVEFIFTHEDNSTENFVKYHADYKAFVSQSNRTRIFSLISVVKRYGRTN